MAGDWQITALFLQCAANVREPDPPSIAGAAVRNPVATGMTAAAVTGVVDAAGAGADAVAGPGTDAGAANAGPRDESGAAAGIAEELAEAMAGRAALPAADAMEPALMPARRAASARRFRPIDDEIRELERARMIEALAATGGVQNRAAELIHMPLRTFVTKLKRYLITPADWSDDR